MQLKCPHCGKGVPARQINVQKLIAVCEHCDTLFNLDTSIAAASTRKRRKVPKPERFQVIEEPGRLQIAYLHREIFGWFEYALAAIFSAICLAGIIGSAVIVSQGAVFPALFVITLVFVLMYITMSMFTNHEVIQVDEDTLTFTTGPLPILSNRRFDLHEVVRLYTKAVGLSGNPSDDYYHVMVEMADGSHKTFLDFMQRIHADYIVQALEDYLSHETSMDESPFIDAGESLESPLKTAHILPTEGEIMLEEPDDDAPVSLDDLLRDEKQNDQQHGHN